MRTVNLTDAKNHLSKYVDSVREGERIRILVRGVPAADLVPVETSRLGDDGEELHLQTLERRGVIHRGTGQLDRDLLLLPPGGGGRPLSDLVIEERRSAR